MSDKKHKHDDAKNRPGPAGGRPGHEAERSDKAGRPPVEQPPGQESGPKGRQSRHGGQPHAGSGNRVPDRD